MKFSAAIFDLDGTIIDSEGIWGEVYVKLLNDLGVKTDDKHPSSVGVSVKANWQNLIQKYAIKTTKTPEELETLSYIEFDNLISKISLKDGALDFIDLLKDNNFPVALATSTKWETADKILDQFGMSDVFDIVTTGEEVINPKPDPDIFILTANKLGVDREDCLVIEDSGSGVTAAREAGMRVVALVDDEKVTPEIEKADKIIESFSDLKLKEIELLFD